MVDIVVLSLSILYITSSIVASFLCLQLYLEYRNIHFIQITSSFFGASMLGLVYTGIIFYEGKEYEMIATQWFSINASIFCLFIALALIGFNNLIEKPFPPRFYLYFPIILVASPLVFLKKVQVRWLGDHWYIDYQHIFFRLIDIIMTSIILLEITYSCYVLVSPTPKKEPKIIVFLLFGCFILGIPTLLLREILNLPINTWFIFLAAFLSLISILMYRHPKVFLTSSIVPEFLLIFDGNSGLPIKLYHFVPNSFERANEGLLTSGISGLQSILKESGDNLSNLTYLGFQNLHLQIEMEYKIQYILASSKKSYALTSLLRKLKNELNLEEFKGKIDSEFEAKLNNTVKNVFSYQLNRLDLLLRDNGL